MTDSSSEEQMVSELLQAKMETARSQTQMTHVMRIGTFHMELVPTKDIDTEEFFNKTLDKLIYRYGDKLVDINVGQMAQPDRNYA